MEAILKAAQSKTKNQLRRFLGLVGYYSRFIPRFATRASPLMDMLEKKHPERLSREMGTQGAFEDLQHALVSSPVLVSPDFTQPFLVQTDASGTGLGAVLAQNLNGDEHPVIFISCKLQPAE